MTRPAAPPETVRVLRRDETLLWDDLVRERAAEPLLAGGEWVDRVARAHGGRAEIVGVFAGEVLVAGVALPVRRRAGLRIATPTHFLAYLPIVAREGAAGAVPAILAFLARRYPLVSLLPSPGDDDMRVYRAAGWDLAYRYTSRVDLRGGSRDLFLGQMDHGQRRAARRAAEGGCSFVRSEDAAEHGRLVLASYGRHRKLFPLPGGPSLDFVGWVIRSGRGRLYHLLRDGRPLVSTLIGIDGKRAYGLEGGGDPATWRGGESALQHLEILVDLAADGFTEYDFLGLNHPGISQFKESFGGALVRYQAAAPPRRLWVRALLRLRRIPDRIEIAGEGSVSR